MGKKGKSKQQDISKDIIKTVEKIYATCCRGSVFEKWSEFEPLHELLNTLERLQHVKSRDGSRLDHVAAFEQWLHQHGIGCDSVKLTASEQEGLGLQAMHPLQKGNRFLCIPKSAMMLAGQAREGHLGKLVTRDPLLQAMPNLSLSLLLLNERCDPHSHWKPYIDMLPAAYSTPLYFGKDDFLLLNGSPVQKECLRQVANVTKLYAHLFLLGSKSPSIAANLLMFQSGFCYRDFCWAVSSVTTRQNEIPVNAGGSHDLALIPLWDMCNHTEGEMSTDYDLATQQCFCYAAHSVAVGEEICIYYGPRPNSKLLVYSGFVYPGNQSDFVNIKLGLSLSEERETRNMRAFLLQDLGQALSGEYRLHAGPVPVRRELLAFIRIFTATKDQLTALTAMPKDQLCEKLHNPTPLAECDDHKALEFLQKRCELLLMVYRRSDEELEELLRSSSTDTSKHVLRLLVCERTLLRSTISYCDRQSSDRVQ